MPETHDVVRAAVATGVPVVTELDLGLRVGGRTSRRARPMLAVTGTDGKTTTTLLVAAMLRAAGRQAVEVGNTDVPLVAALDIDADVFVVECSSFRLNWLRSFRPDAVGVAQPRARTTRTGTPRSPPTRPARRGCGRTCGRPTSAIGNARDPIVMRNLARVRARRATFGGAGADYRLRARRARRAVGHRSPRPR